MERVIFVEVLGRRGDVALRVRLERLPAIIGRGYQCDVIVGDLLVDPQHARLTRDEQGTIVLEDLDSLNGLYADGARRRSARIVVAGVTTARIGRTLLRIAPADAAVPPAIPDTESGDRLAAFLASPRRSAGVLGGCVAAAALWLWLGTFESRAVSVAGGEALGLALLTTLWAGFWALIGRANVQRFSFWPHLTLTWLALVALGTTSLLAGYAEFLFPDGPAGALALLVTLLLGGGLLARHLGLATLLPRRRRNAIAAVTVAAVLGLVLLAGHLASDELEGDTVALRAALKPVPARLVPATDLAAFVSTSDGVKQEIDRLGDGK